MKILQRAHAKINWAIDVVGARPDGYHEIDMLMQAIELHDEITFEEACGISLKVDDISVPADGANLVIRAAQALNEYAGANRGASITLKKRVPVGAGLGGGSADCAVTLIALNKLWNLNIPMGELMDISARLGKDVPFCMYRGAARVTGAGEKLTRIKSGMMNNIVIAYPGGGLSTRQVYSKWDEMKGEIPRVNIDMAQKALERGDIDELRLYAKNALEPVATAIMPRIGRIKDELLSMGGRFALMTGSGSSVFAVFDDMEKARFAMSRLSCRCILTKTI